MFELAARVSRHLLHSQSRHVVVTLGMLGATETGLRYVQTFMSICLFSCLFFVVLYKVVCRVSLNSKTCCPF